MHYLLSVCGVGGVTELPCLFYLRFLSFFFRGPSFFLSGGLSMENHLVIPLLPFLWAVVIRLSPPFLNLGTPLSDLILTLLSWV